MSRLQQSLRKCECECPIFLVIVTALAMSCQLVNAQAPPATGSVRGVVTDNSGAVVAGALASLTSRAHGWTQTRASNSAGIFVFPSQAVGLYQIEVTAPGFRKEIVESLLVQVGQTATVNARLQPGSERESVTVIGESPLLRTEDSRLQAQSSASSCWTIFLSAAAASSIWHFLSPMRRPTANRDS